MAVRHVAVALPCRLFETLAESGMLKLVACMTPSARKPSFLIQQQLMGKTRSQIPTCAGPPKREMTGERGVNLTYYREAQFTTLPPSSGAYDLCEAIFEQCENE